jgi:hypothetical protein
VQRQRQRLRSGDLTPHRKQLLDAIGMPWSLLDDEWNKGLAAATGYAAAHGDLDAPTQLVTGSGYPLGQWLATRRKQARTGRLIPGRRAQLDALDPNWHTARSRQSRWDANYHAARAYAGLHGHLPTGKGAAASPAPHGHDFRPWLREQRQLARRGKLPPERHIALAALDPNWRGPATPRPVTHRP